MTTLYLQADAYKSIRPLAEVSTQAIESLVQRLKASLTPQLYVQDVLGGFLGDVVSGSITTDGLIEAITGVHFVRLSLRKSAEETAQFIRNSFAESGEDLGNEELENLQKNTHAVLGVEALAASFKASSLIDDHERIFVSAKIVTDIRPVFRSGDSEASDIDALVLMHAVNVTFRNDDGVQRQYFIADDEDLENLREAIVEALTRSKALSRRLRILDMGPVIGSSRDQDPVP